MLAPVDFQFHMVCGTVARARRGGRRHRASPQDAACSHNPISKVLGLLYYLGPLSSRVFSQGYTTGRAKIGMMGILTRFRLCSIPVVLNQG